MEEIEKGTVIFSDRNVFFSDFSEAKTTKGKISCLYGAFFSFFGCFFLDKHPIYFFLFLCSFLFFQLPQFFFLHLFLLLIFHLGQEVIVLGDFNDYDPDVKDINDNHPLSNVFRSVERKRKGEKKKEKGEKQKEKDKKKANKEEKGEKNKEKEHKKDNKG